MLTAMLLAVPASAQITIGGNVYGGGNKGNMTNTENTTESLSNVTVKGGSITGKVFGGARMAGVNGGTHVKLDGEKASADIIIGEVYGGNDIAGTVSGTALVESTYRADVADATQNARIYVTNLYGGGNGDYDYTSEQVQKTDAEGNKLYIQEDGTTEGTTVTGNPVMVENPYKDKVRPEIANTEIKLLSGCYSQVFAGGNSATVTASAKITLDNSTTRLLDATGSILAYQFDRVFGGNNQVPMAIRPTWELTKASINNLYSGGNAGDMTHTNGILLAITGDDMTINNVYGGCRMADVNPDKHTITSETIEGVAFPGGYAARTLIKGGTITNVYGGNDISGDVYGGSALEIRSSILGDVYGGGNGSYAYTDNVDLAYDDTYGDYYYDVPEGKTSAEALYDHRPNAESVYMHVMGTEAKPTYIGGSLYCGGNSATLTGTNDNSAQLEIGSYVIADKVFLGSNGENMVSDDILSKYAGSVMVGGKSYDYSQMNLTTSNDFEQYMKGVEVGIKPSVGFDTDYKEYSTKFGSLYCGGNVGSMSAEGMFTISFLNSLVIYDKIVGGCNNANVAYKEGVNAYHMGGLTNTAGVGNAKVVLNISGVKLEPRKLVPVTNGSAPFQLAWNTDVIKVNNEDKTILKGANIYGGCYSSGYVNGRVEINVTADAISKDVFAASGGSGADFATLRDNPLVSTMSVYGGGYGQETEIWGNVAVNITNNAHILKVYGGGEEGIVGKMNRVDGVQQTTAETAYGTTVTLNATAPTATEGFAALNAAKIYGGGFKGLVTGNTHVDLDKGSVYNAFAGACNADIWGGTEIYVGKLSVPTVYNNIYGGNDFGGQIKGALQHSAQYDAARYQTVRSNTYLEYYDAKIVGSVFGGPCGSYDYNDDQYKYTDENGTKQAASISMPKLLTEVSKEQSAYAANSFVNVVADNYANKVTRIFGAGEGLAGFMENADVDRSYVLLHSSANAQMGLLADHVYGAGDCSTTNYSLVDAYTGQFGTIYGGCRGVSLAEKIHQENVATLTYMGELSEVNLWGGMNNKLMDVYGGGAYSGTKESKVTLNGGYAHDVYGASYNQGITYLATVEVPSTSTAHVNAIFGGGKGEATLYPCDTYTSFINYNSAKASVETAIYGGNNQYRITRFPHININVPVKNADGDLKDVYGAGYGENTIAQYTKVNLNANSNVNNVFGGGRDGKVYDMETVAKFMEGDYFESMSAYASKDIEITGYSAWYNDPDHQSINGETIYTLTAKPTIRNTQVLIAQNALVSANAYGGGEGSKATVSGTTGIDLVGGMVTADLYGGGLGGNVMAELGATYSSSANSPSTSVRIQGGKVRNVYGGGLEGHVEGDVNTVLGTRDQDNPTFADGLPTVERSLYGGGEKGHVSGIANLTINNGYVGYKYVDGEFVENVDYKVIDDKILAENGNAFGGGYGEGAYVDHTYVTLYGGIIRNGLYGGGEIAAVGRGTANVNEEGKPTGTFDLTSAGETHIKMYAGHIVGDVFGGGRGFSYDLAGNEIIGKTYFSDGYVFGTTDVEIFGGEIGTAENVADGHGNVFGGGNIGYVYSVNGTKYTGESNANKTNGYYYGSDGKLTEDCHVLISPYAKVKEAVEINGHNYNVNEFVTTEDMNYLRGKDSEDKSTWEKIDYLTGVTVRNAVFAGGNVSAGSDKVYANAKTVFGNATATLYDVYHRDLITIGTEHTGGLYGDGNLTFVDGYRELNITNYGTDYYGQSDNITIAEYHALNDRERAYFQLKYKCVQDITISGKEYKAGDSLEEEDYKNLPEDYKNTTYWVEAGFCSIYAGRLLNTLQRADFVGIFGSRMVLQGAQDRVPSIVDYTNYTINRVGEVSLNKMASVIAADATTDENEHGNYFGIYNIVNLLGALTSDVNFSDIRKTNNNNADYKTEANGKEYGAASFLDWKMENQYKRKRNNGTCHNKVALASGVYLEIVDHIAEGTETDSQNPDLTYAKGDKVYGPVTGILELDLINVMKGLGGGYVYAKNIHGAPSGSLTTKTTLAYYNKNAKTSYGFSYNQSSCSDYQTSGNFIHNTKQIVDDCYPGSMSYTGSDASSAHHWYIKGEVYVYDQYLSAYTGSSVAYKQDIKIPLTITAGSHGQIKLTDIQPNFYAYYMTNSTDASGNAVKAKLGMEGSNDKVVIGEKTYYLNDEITYWGYQLLTEEQKKLFVPMTYVAITECTVDGTTYPKGYALLPEEYTTLSGANSTVYNVELQKSVPIADVFRKSNDLTHEKGYVVSFDISNPMVWNKWYTLKQGTSVIDTETPANSTRKNTNEYAEMDATNQAKYFAGPTFTPTTSGVYGQQSHEIGDIIYGSTKTAYDPIASKLNEESQAIVEQAYVAMEDIEYTYQNVVKNAQKGVGIPETEYNALTAAQKAKFAVASVCTSTLEMTTTDTETGKETSEYIFFGDLIPKADIAALNTKYPGADQNFDDAYYCTKAGLYGGSYFETNNNYRALEAWAALSADDRAKFTYNYDALDLLSTNYSKDLSEYRYPYYVKTPVDYTAIYRGTSALTYTNKDGSHTVNTGDSMTRSEYENIPNEQYHWSNINVTDTSIPYYIVKSQFIRGDVSYLVGQTVTLEAYGALNDDQRSHLDKYEFDKVGNYYYCRENYTIDENGEGVAITSYACKKNDETVSSSTIAKNENVPVGTIISGGSLATGVEGTGSASQLSENMYASLPNKQKNFTIHGTSPVETTTLYVSRESDINDLSKDRVITVIYTYDYEESDDSQTHIEQISERHVINIHLQFKSGVPTISPLQNPATVLPGSTVGLRKPNVTPGAYQLLGGGWEYYKNAQDAENHNNGLAYVNNDTKMYWYQDGWYAAYYAKTYLGKTYSNAVPFSVANYHDMEEVMADTEHHMYIDNNGVKRAPKIYLDDTYDENSQKSELDMLKDLFDETIAGGEFNSEQQIDACANLDFILRSDVSPKKYTDWTPIGADASCFSGNLHGQGYTIGGLNNSLFKSLCGNVYNLGVTGSFSTAGIADTGDGYIENSWISTTGTPDGSAQAVFGNPSRSESSAVQMKNCYYPATKAYKSTGTHGVAKAMPEKSFYNGEVAYDLNGFYLDKRYYDVNLPGSGVEYKYWTINPDDNKKLDLQTSKYATTEYTYPETGDEAEKSHLNYVERLYADGDFIYAGGVVPEDDNERWYVDESKYYPIYPDDYIFFGQMLTYGYVAGDNYVYQEKPSRIYKTDKDRLFLTDRSNRVFRAPAYFMNKTMDKAHFNYLAVLADKSSDNKELYPNMTAVDFTACNDKAAQSGWLEPGTDATLKTSWAECFYPPFLDYDGLKSYQSHGLTQNMLVYANPTDASSYKYLAEALYEPTLTQGTYNKIAVATTNNVIGHLVDLAEGAYVASRNHLLVDRQNFNAPIRYQFDDGNYMWYQRTPDVFADGSAGWETICLPFSADLVTTHQKGEITHFYGTDAKNKIGHEYWLRGLTAVTTAEGTTTAAFVRPMNGTTSNNVDNTFLWDYYYSQSERDDANRDDYQQYWNNTRTFENYPYYAEKTPYIISFPGANFYEFDMSGTFVPQNTYQTIAQLDKQTVSFVSSDNQVIEVSDDEARTTDANGYHFRGFYQADDFDTNAYYALDEAGEKFVKGAAATKAVPFRAYFRTTEANVKAETIFIGPDADYIDDPDDNRYDGTIQVYGMNDQLHIVSYMDEDTLVPVYNMSGQLIKNVQLRARAHEKLRVPSGIYVAHGKKAAVR